MRVARPPTNEYRSGPSNATSTTSYMGETDNGTRSMTPLQRIREDPEKVRDMLAARGFEAPLDRILGLDRKARELRAQVEALNAQRNKASRGGPPSDDLKARMREVGEKIKGLQAEITALEAQRDDL